MITVKDYYLLSDLLTTDQLQLPQVAIIREEGSNGDREMAAAFMMAGFETWDVNMQDLAMESITLDRFQGLVFVGGFSYADVFGSAKGELLKKSYIKRGYY